MNRKSRCGCASQHRARQRRGLCADGQPAERAATPAVTTPAASSDKMMLKSKWRVSKLMGLDVYNEANEKLGDVNELILDKDGKVDAVDHRRWRLPRYG